MVSNQSPEGFLHWVRGFIFNCHHMIFLGVCCRSRGWRNIRAIFFLKLVNTLKMTSLHNLQIFLTPLQTLFPQNNVPLPLAWDLWLPKEHPAPPLSHSREETRAESLNFGRKTAYFGKMIGTRIVRQYQPKVKCQNVRKSEITPPPPN